MRNKPHTNRFKRMRADAKHLAGMLNQPWKEVYKLMKKGE